jgi:hypothetical protein
MNTVRKIFNILKDLKAMSEDIQELQLSVDSLESDKADEMDLWDLIDEATLCVLEDRVEGLEASVEGLEK